MSSERAKVAQRIAEKAAHDENNERHLRALREHSKQHPSTCICNSRAMLAAGILCPVHACPA